MIYYIVHFDDDTEEMQLLRFTVGGGFGRGVVAYSEKSNLDKKQVYRLIKGTIVYDKDDNKYTTYLEWIKEWKLRLSAHSGIHISKIQ